MANELTKDPFKAIEKLGLDDNQMEQIKLAQ